MEKELLCLEIKYNDEDTDIDGVIIELINLLNDYGCQVDTVPVK